MKVKMNTVMMVVIIYMTSTKAKHNTLSVRKLENYGLGLLVIVPAISDTNEGNKEAITNMSYHGLVTSKTRLGHIFSHFNLKNE